MAEEENIRKSVEIALATVTKRRSNLRASAPDYIQSRWEYLGIDQIVSAMEIQNSPPFTIDKYFISDMAIMASRVWECFSMNPEGIFNDVISNAISFTQK
jgi:hypothetical protein